LDLAKARDAADHAVAIYRECIDKKGELASTCDRRLADVQWLMGSVYFNAKEFVEAEPWFKAVVDRRDDAVRPEAMLVSLKAYAALLAWRGETQEATRFAVRAVQFEKDHPGSNNFIKPNK
jgi:hypothetical protein